MPESTQETDRVQAKDRRAWRRWLKAHHANTSRGWLVYAKKSSGEPSVTYDEAVEEALCFGWIDSRPNRLDNDHAMQLFSPRKRGSPWSRLNKRRVERLIAAGRMAAAGLTAVAAAKRDGSWTAYDAIEDLTVPDDLAAAFATNAAAREQFEGFSASSKKQILWWIASAKRAETRARRIEEAVHAAAAGKNPQNWREKRRT